MYGGHLPGARVTGETEKNIIQTVMKNNVKMTFGSAYEAPEVQVTEVLVEQGFQASLGGGINPGSLNYGEDVDEFE